MNLELLSQLKEALAKLVVLLTALSSLTAPISQPVGSPVLGGAIQIASTPVISKLDRFEVPFSEKVPQEGETKVEMMKDRPKVILSKWNGEVQMGVEYKKVTANAQKLVSSNEVKWGAGNEIVHAYKKDADNFEIEIELKSKPATNKFDFTITGAENLDFFYQPELTAEEIAEGVSRPENVVGSYAVYHKTKANHRVGSTNYATGKAYHIFRPKAIDASGVETWAELLYLNGVLIVTVPQQFLDSAVYPVTIDPTFGYTSLGASNFGIANVSSDTSSRLGRGFNLTEAGTLDSLHAGLDASAAGQSVDTIVFVNREDTVTDSHAQVASVEQLNLSISTTEAFYTFTAAGEILTADDYILSALANGEDVASGQISLRGDTLTGNSGTIYFETATGAGSYNARKENPWTETDVASETKYSIYATYEAAGGAAAASRRRSIIITDD